MPSPTYALTSPSSQPLGVVRSWKASSGATNGSIAASGSTSWARMCSTSTEYCTYSVLARPAIAAFRCSVGARSASSASRMNAVSSP